MYSLNTLSEIHFELSSHCNSKCPQCPRYDTVGRVHQDLQPTHIDLNLIKKLPIDQMPMLKKVQFCGNFGDPLMHPQLDEIIDVFKNYKIMISTNASLRSKEWWSNLGKNKNVSVIFCIDGIGDVHEIYRRNTSYEKIMDNAKSFISAGGEAHWQFLIFKHNTHQIKQAEKICDEVGFKSIKFQYSDRFDTEDTWQVYDNGKYLYDLEKPELQITLRQKLNVPAGKKHWSGILQDKGDISCVWSHNKRLYIHSDGGVYPCCMLASVQVGKNIEKLLLQKLVKDFSSINLHDNNLSNILSSDVFTSILPSSFSGDPFQHPICIEFCNKKTGKINLSHINKPAQIDNLDK